MTLCVQGYLALCVQGCLTLCVQGYLALCVQGCLTLCVQSLEQELDQAEEEAVVASTSSRVSTPPHSTRQDSESGLETWIKHDRCVQPAE